MTAALKTVSLVALAATILPSLMYLTGAATHDTVKWVALAGTIVWFVVTPIWMGRNLPPDADQAKI